MILLTKKKIVLTKSNPNPLTKNEEVSTIPPNLYWSHLHTNHEKEKKKLKALRH